MEIVAFIILFGGFCLLAWAGLNLWETFTWSLSGEAGAVLHRGFGSKGRRLRQTVELESIVGHIALITRLNLPLHSALRAAGRGEPGRVGKTLSYMGYLISAGWPVSEALGAAFKGCPVQLVSILRQGEQCGQFPRAVADVKRMLAAATRGHTRLGGQAASVGAYAGLMLIAITLVLFWIVTFVVPRWIDIFYDFETRLPPITQALIAVYGWTLMRGGRFLIIVLGGLLAVAVLGIWSRGKRQAGVFVKVVSGLRWLNPITRTIDYGLGMATAIRTMVLGMRGGAAVDRAVILTSTVGTTNHLRYRLTGFVQEVQAGVVPHQAAQNAKLGDVFISALRMVERGEDAARVLNHAADYYEAIALRWWQAVSVVTGPLVTLLIAGVVGFVALAMFLPLVTLINAVADTVG